MWTVLFLLLALGSAVGQSVPMAYEPDALARYLRGLQEAEEKCEVTTKGCDAFFVDESVSKELQTSLHVHSCSDITSTHVHLDGLHEAGLVQMQCGWDLNLIFTQKNDGRWQFLQTIIVPNKYEEATVSVASVTGDGSQQVLVHKAQYQSGTGIKQQNFVVYKLIDTKLCPVLDAVESAYVMPPVGETEVSQDSQFVYEPPTARDSKGFATAPGFKEIEVIKFAGVQVELKRDHTWSAKKCRFEVSQWFSARELARDKNLGE